jgi:hypothetical protein
MQIIKKIIETCLSLAGLALSDQDRANIKAMQNKQHKNPHQAARAFWNKVENGKAKIPNIATTLTPGDLSENTDWLYIQDLGPYILPNGTDNKHTVHIYKTAKHEQNLLLASIECTNSIYSEWIVACANSMWQTQNKVFYDIHGNMFALGKMSCTKCQIVY